MFLASRHWSAASHWCFAPRPEQFQRQGSSFLPCYLGKSFPVCSGSPWSILPSAQTKLMVQPKLQIIVAVQETQCCMLRPPRAVQAQLVSRKLFSCWYCNNCKENSFTLYDCFLHFHSLTATLTSVCSTCFFPTTSQCFSLFIGSSSIFMHIFMVNSPRVLMAWHCISRSLSGVKDSSRSTAETQHVRLTEIFIL